MYYIEGYEMPKKVTIKDIAETAGVSAGTVDRVIHNRGRVSEKNRTAIQNAIEKLSYQYSFSTNLSASRNIKIGISYPLVECEFWKDISFGINKAKKLANDIGIEIIEDNTSNHSIENQLESVDRLIKDYKVNAIIITPVTDSFSSQLDTHIPKSIPYATVIDDTIGSERVFHIGPNNIALGTLMAKMIKLYINKPTINIAILSPDMNFSGTQQRISGLLNKTKLDNMNINILSINTIKEKEVDELRQTIYDTTLSIIDTHKNLDALYVTYGFGEWVCKALEKSS